VYFKLQYFCVPDAWLFCFVVSLVISVSLGLLYIFVVLSGFDSVFSVIVKRLAEKSISKMTYRVAQKIWHHYFVRWGTETVHVTPLKRTLASAP